jgi:membrane protease YdiL (CAAX protease family)
MSETSIASAPRDRHAPGGAAGVAGRDGGDGAGLAGTLWKGGFDTLVVVVGIWVVSLQLAQGLAECVFIPIKFLDRRSWLDLIGAENIFHKSYYYVVVDYAGTIFIVAIATMYSRRNAGSFIQIFPAMDKGNIRVYCLSFLLFPVFIGVYEIYAIALTRISVVDMDPFTAPTDAGFYLTQLIYFSLLTPVAEEFLWRYLALNLLAAKGAPKAGLYLVPALAFACFHLNHNGLFGVPLILPVGLALTYAALKTRSILLPILIHGAFNIPQFQPYLKSVIGFYTGLRDHVCLDCSLILHR